MRELKVFPYFKNFHEAPISFYPTFKFDITHKELSRSQSAPVLNEPDKLHYDSSLKQRVPSWTDRILWKSKSDKKKVIVKNYTSHMSEMSVIGFSDHRPVTGCFFVDFDWSQFLREKKK